MKQHYSPTFHILSDHVHCAMRVMVRALPIALFLITDICTFAQVADLKVCRARVRATGEHVSPKPMIIAVTEWIDVMDIDLEQQDQVLRFTTSSAVDLTTLSGRIANTGYQAQGLQCRSNSGAVISEGLPPYPVFEDTGDEAGDNARFDAAKADWIREHPEAYRRLTGLTLTGHEKD